MKPKNFNKRLTLNKKTVAHLNNKEMKNVGGVNPSFDTWCEGSCLVPVGEGSGCYSYPRGFACVCADPNQ